MITAYKLDGTNSALLASKNDLPLLGDGWTLNKLECASVPVVYSRSAYKGALDAMLIAQCKHGDWDFDGIQTLAVYLFDPANKFYPRAMWLAKLNVFTWETSDNMAKAADANPEAPKPSPEQFAAYILALFEANNPRPA